MYLQLELEDDYVQHDPPQHRRLRKLAASGLIDHIFHHWPQEREQYAITPNKDTESTRTKLLKYRSL